ncbi:MAG: septal ring lytic transglycosylase RlpA family protein [Mycobacteriales bacterium]|nr:septal ring lytic transglycosylase RlpA family protein [Mycobacteriales bacterium]
MVATTAATALIAALGTSLVPSGAASAEQSVEDASVSALSELPPRVVAAPAATPQRASRGAARTPPRATKLVWRSVAVGPAFRGEASWYGPGFQGRTTANGERYDMYAMTAAHKTLPFGTRLKVCRGERCVVVRINDRGPYAGGRVLDLSKAAAQQLGYSGTAWVSATPVRQKQVRVPA